MQLRKKIQNLELDLELIENGQIEEDQSVPKLPIISQKPKSTKFQKVKNFKLNDLISQTRS